MSELFIFGGTTEGRLLAEFCCEKNISAEISVTTAYGANLLPRNDLITVTVKRLNAEEMSEKIKKSGCIAVIDATHPYAEEATENIKAACVVTGTRYVRLLRNESCETGGAVADNMDALVEYLNKSDYQVLSTLGSKELKKLTEVKDYNQRIWIRVLPTDGMTELCEELGFDVNKLICEKGPFSVEQNISHIRFSGAELLVTKESGSTGGYPEKLQAARLCGTELLTLKRPKESGLSFDGTKKLILELCHRTGV